MNIITQRLTCNAKLFVFFFSCRQQAKVYEHSFSNSSFATRPVEKFGRRPSEKAARWPHRLSHLNDLVPKEDHTTICWAQ